MKIAFTTTFDSRDVSNWSGTPFHMANAFQEQGVSIQYFGNLQRKLPAFFKIKQFWKKFACGQRESPRFNIVAAKYYSQQVARSLDNKIHAVIAPQINPIAYLECKQPIVLWTDGLYASLVGFYPGFSTHSAESIKQGNIITRECLTRCRYAVFSSDWAARTAIEIYGIHKEKVKVIPFGANIHCHHTLDDIKAMLKERNNKKIKLLFIGKHWERKGGSTVFSVAQSLHHAGYPVEVNFVGCMPPKEIQIPSYIHCHGFVSKNTREGVEKIQKLLRESHFLFVPSRAEAYGIVFCEANAYALPCLTTHIGGIPTIVKENVNGKTFSLNASVIEYCDYILTLMHDYSRYEQLALSAFNEYKTRLNWQVAVDAVKKLIE